MGKFEEKIRSDYIKELGNKHHRLERLSAQDKYLLAKCLISQEDMGEEQLADYIKQLESSCTYEEIKKQFFKKNLIRFACNTEQFDYELLKQPNGFNVVPPKENPDITYYVPREKDGSKFQQLLSEGKNILVRGPSKIGKSRFVYEMLKESPERLYVFALQQKVLLHTDPTRFIMTLTPNKRKIIWFIDDYNYFSGYPMQLSMVYEELILKFECIQVVATLRSEEEFDKKSRIAKDMQPFDISPWEEDEINDLISHYGKTRDKFACTPFSIIGNIEYIKELYDKLPVEYKNIFRYLRILKDFLQDIDYLFLEEVFCHLNGESKGKVLFEKGIKILANNGLVMSSSGKISSWEPYLEELVNENEYFHMDSDRAKLINIFADLNKYIELFYFSFYFYKNKILDKAIECFKKLNLIIPDKNTIKLQLYNNWGVVLLELAELNKDKNLYLDAIEKYKKAVKFKKDYPEPYNNWGLALSELAKLKGDENLYLDAVEKYKKAIDYKEDYPEPYNNWGLALSGLAKLKGDENLYLDAVEKYKKAIDYKEDYPESYNNWGLDLSGLAELKGDENLYLDAVEKYKKAIDYKEDYPESYNNWGLALSELAKLKGDENLYLEAIEKYKKAIKFKITYPEAYYNWGNALLELALQRGDEQSYQVAIEKYKKAIELNESFPEVYGNLGLALYKLAKKRGDEQLYQDSFEKFKKAVEFKEDYPEAHCNWGVALSNLALQKGDEQLYIDSFEKFKRAVEFKGNLPEAYYNWGNALSELAKLKGDKSLYFIAIEKYKRAIVYKEDDPMIFNSYGNALSKLAKLNSDENLYLDAFEKYKKAVELKNDPEIYNNWGSTLAALALQKGDERLYLDAFEKYNKAIEFKGNFPEIYGNFGIDLYSYGKLINYIRMEEILYLLIKSYTLSILQNRQDYTSCIGNVLTGIAMEFKNESCIIIPYIFDFALTLINDSNSISNIMYQELTKFKGKIPSIDILLDAIIDKKIPPEYSEDDDFLTKTAIFLANKVIQKFNLSI